MIQMNLFSIFLFLKFFSVIFQFCLDNLGTSLFLVLFYPLFPHPAIYYWLQSLGVNLFIAFVLADQIHS